MKQHIGLIFLAIFLSHYSYGQNKDITINRNGITFPNGKELNDPINARTDIPAGLGLPNIYAEISGVDGAASASNCSQCVDIYAFDSYLFRNIDDRQILSQDLNKELFVLSKKIDVASDDLLSLLENRQSISSVAIKIFVSNPDGQSILQYSITLNNAFIAEHRFKLVYDQTTDETNLIEKYYFTYESITYTGDGSTVVLD